MDGIHYYVFRCLRTYSSQSAPRVAQATTCQLKRVLQVDGHEYDWPPSIPRYQVMSALHILANPMVAMESIRPTICPRGAITDVQQLNIQSRAKQHDHEFVTTIYWPSKTP
jgi:hypothetical protein